MSRTGGSLCRARGVLPPGFPWECWRAGWVGWGRWVLGDPKHPVGPVIVRLPERSGLGDCDASAPYGGLTSWARTPQREDRMRPGKPGRGTPAFTPARPRRPRKGWKRRRRRGAWRGRERLTKQAGAGGQRQVLARGREDGELSSGLGGRGGTGDLSRSYFGGRWGPWPRRRGSGSERARSLARAVEGGQGPEARALRH